ncbi:MAG: hypothetical protein INR73_07840 [Williamsia sp.]|nr:hypothetical protein [Williamsia sp.]
MKNLFAILLLIGLAYGASAQHARGGHAIVRSHTGFGLGIGTYAPFGYGYNRFYSPFYSYPYSRPYAYSQPTKLDLQVQDIENEYDDKKWAVKHDKSLDRKQRKEALKVLKAEKENAILDARTNYYKANP